MQRHLDQAGAAQSALNETGSEWGRAIAKCFCRRCHGWNRALPLAPVSRTGLQVRAEAGIQANIVVRRIEAGVVEEVEELRVIAQCEALVQFKEFEDAEVETRLKWAAECVATGARESRF